LDKEAATTYIRNDVAWPSAWRAHTPGRHNGSGDSCRW
jgi:hypothetical protein